MNYSHVPVLLKEVLQILNLQNGDKVIDATLGGSGYSQSILEKISPRGKLLSIDLDIAAIFNAQSLRSGKAVNNWQIAQGNFTEIDKIASQHGFAKVDKIIADIGLSSFQLDEAGRGISFQKDEPLDMRFNASESTSLTAKLVVNSYSETELTKIFSDYGEEKFSRLIAKNIAKQRQQEEISSSAKLAKLIEQSLPKPVQHKWQDSARRIFQALRIEVNGELQNLQNFLPKAFNLLSQGGILAVVSFHSLEDRMVKNFFAELQKGCICPKDFPECVCSQKPKAKTFTKKPIIASAQEIESNSRSASAKLRAIIKL